MAQKSRTITFLAAAFGIVLITGIAIGLFAASVSPVAEANPGNNPKALNGYVIVADSSGSPSTTPTKTARATCPEGKGPIAGGYQMSGSVDDAVIIDNHPTGALTVQEPGEPPEFIPDGWQVRIKRFGGIGGWSILAFAACVDIVPEAE